MVNKEKLQEHLLYLAAGILWAIAFIAWLGGDGDKGFFDLF